MMAVALIESVDILLDNYAASEHYCESKQFPVFPNDQEIAI